MDVATVLDLETNEIVRYTNYPFISIITIKDDIYGVTNSGLYLLRGATDDSTPIDTILTTKKTNFGTATHKNIPYIYVDNEGVLDVTPIVDGVVKSTYTGAKAITLGKGLLGRFWQFTFNKIHKLTSLDIDIVNLQKRV